MLKVRLFTEKEWLGLFSISNKESEYRVDDAKFYFKHRLLDTAYAEEPHIPFRDAESLQFLKETYGITFISDDDWYSVYCEDSRSDITCLYESIQLGLAAIDMSRHGIYAWQWSAEDEIWQALANMPFDILIAMRTSEMGLHGQHGISCVDYLIENYPYRDQSLEVFVKKTSKRPDINYIKVPELERGEYDNCFGLLRGSDGRYYSDWVSIEYAFQYYWKNDIGGIIQQIDRMHKDRTPLADTTRVYDIFELGELLDNDRNCIMSLDYLCCLDWLTPEQREGKCKKCHEERQPEECYREYLYFRDKFRIISHLAFAPERISCRKLPVLMVDKNTDGTYFIHGCLTVKNSTFHELFYDVICERSAERERFVLIIDVEELLDSAYDLESAVCGFKVLEDSVEIYDNYEGTQLFGAALKEAYSSRRCTVDKKFY